LLSREETRGKGEAERIEVGERGMRSGVEKVTGMVGDVKGLVWRVRYTVVGRPSHALSCPANIWNMSGAR
jgi:hypothetical protein